MLRLGLWLREGELTPVVIEVLGPEVVDVQHAHCWCEVGVPAGRHVHAQCQVARRLGSKATAERTDAGGSRRNTA